MGCATVAGVIVRPGSPLGVEVNEVRYGDPYGPAWQQLGSALWDALAVVLWTLVAGSIAFGSCWFMGQFMYTAWVREHPPPRLRFVAERKLRRDIARGLGDLEEYLRERGPACPHDVPSRPARFRTWRRPGAPRR